MRLCKDCKHSIDPHFSLQFLRCSKSVDKVDVCTGKTKYNFCSYARFEPHWLSFLVNSCGKRGRWFEPKEKS